VALAMPIMKWDAGLMCKVPIIMWLIVAASIYVMSLLKNIIVICSIYQPSEVVSPKEIK
jgi:hypothetical protein